MLDVAISAILGQNKPTKLDILIPKYKTYLWPCNHFLQCKCLINQKKKELCDRKMELRFEADEACTNPVMHLGLNYLRKQWRRNENADNLHFWKFGPCKAWQHVCLHFSVCVSVYEWADPIIFSLSIAVELCFSAWRLSMA